MFFLTWLENQCVLETVRKRIDGGELSPLPETTETLGLKLGDFE